MRTLLALMILCLPASGHAVDSAECPNNVQVSYEDLIPVSEKKIERLRRNPNRAVYRTAVKARDSIIRTPPERVQDLGFKFKNGDGGVCTYGRAGGGEGRLEVFTKRGAEFLRVYFPYGAFELYTVHTLVRVNPRGLKDLYRPTTPLYIRVGAQSYHVGWAYSLTLEN